MTSKNDLPKTSGTVFAQAIEALEAAKNGLQWYRGLMPQCVDGSDDEADAQIDAAIASLRSADAGVQPADTVQPIATAPKTGLFIGWDGHGPEVWNAETYWQSIAPNAPPACPVSEAKQLTHWSLGLSASPAATAPQAAMEGQQAGVCTACGGKVLPHQDCQRKRGHERPHGCVASPAVAPSAQPVRMLTRAEIDKIVYQCRQAGDDSTYAIVNAAIGAAPSAQPARMRSVPWQFFIDMDSALRHVECFGSDDAKAIAASIRQIGKAWLGAAISGEKELT